MPPHYGYVAPYLGVPFVDLKLTADQKTSVNYFREKKRYGFSSEQVAYAYMQRRHSPNPYILRAEELILSQVEWSKWTKSPDSKQLHACTVKFLITVYEAEIGLRAVGRGWYVTTDAAGEQRVVNRYLNLLDAFFPRIQRSQNLQARSKAHQPHDALTKQVQDEFEEPVLAIADSLNDVREHKGERKELLEAMLLMKDFKRGLVVVPSMTPQECKAYVRRRLREAIVNFKNGHGGSNGQR
jgi:hypothetical protein